MLDTETKHRIDTARDILVGKVPDPKSQVEQITIALIYKFMDDMDKESIEFGGNASFFSGEYEKYSWSNIFDPRLGGYDMLNLYSEAILKLNINPNIPQLFRDIFKNAYLPYRDPETLKLFLKTINEFNYDHSERLGDAFEYLLSVLSSQGDAGQFRTPRHIIDFIVAALAPKKNETVLDPACGTAGFLISAYKFIRLNLAPNDYFEYMLTKSKYNGNADNNNNNHINQINHSSDNLTPQEKKKLVQNFAGYDISPDMVRLSLVNMYLHNFTNPRIYEYDTLTSEDRWGEYFDIIMANPPFMSPKGGIRPHKKFTIQANRSEVLFVDYIAEHIHPVSGRAGVIVPEGIIFQSANAYKSLRKMLVEKNFLFAVISLPAGVFQPYSGVKTSILLMDKTIAKKTDKILFIKVENDGYSLGAQRKEIEKNDLIAALSLIKNYKLRIKNEEEEIKNEKLKIKNEEEEIKNEKLKIKNEEEEIKNEKLKIKNEGLKTEIEGILIFNSQFLIVPKADIAKNGDYNLSIDRYRINDDLKKMKYEMVRLGDICETSSGGTPLRNKSEYYENGTIPWLKSGEVTQGYIYKTEEYITEIGLKNSSSKIFPENTVLVALYGATAGEVGILKFPAATNQAVCGILPKVNISPEFLYLVLKTKKNDMVQLCAGGAQQNLSQGIIQDLLIPLPPLSIQQEIVAKIENYQKIIDGAKQIVANYKPQIDIDPDWEMVELGEVITLQRGYDLPKQNWIEGKFPIVGSNGIIGFHNTYKEKGPGVVTGRSGTIGKVHFIDYDFYWPHNTALFVKDFKGNNPKYIKFLLESIDLKSLGANTAAVPSLDRKEAHKSKIYIPPLEIQQEIVTRIEAEQKLVDANKELIKIFEQKIKAEIEKLWE